MIEFLRKFENSGIKIARVNSIRITKSIDLQLFTLIFYVVGGPLWSKAIFRALSIYRKVYYHIYMYACFPYLVFFTNCRHFLRPIWDSLLTNRPAK